MKRYYQLVKKIPNSPRKKGDIFLEMPFSVAVSERFDWKQVFGISAKDIIKYRKYLKNI